MTVERNLGVTIAVRAGIVMHHTVLRVDDLGNPVGVGITTNPLEFRGCYAQIVMHKTRSHNCAVQVARYVRRTFDLTDTVVQHKSNRPLEAMIGYVCTGGLQHPPDDTTPGFDVIRHIALTSIKQLLEEVVGGTNAARTRYRVYEIREMGGARRTWRAVTNKFHAVERIWLECPADTVEAPDLAHLGSFETRASADALLENHEPITDLLWRRRPAAEYLHRILEIRDDHLYFRASGYSAVRPYAVPTVVLGPHSYTLPHVLHAMRSGRWHDGYFRRASGPDVTGGVG